MQRVYFSFHFHYSFFNDIYSEICFVGEQNFRLNLGLKLIQI